MMVKDTMKGRLVKKGFLQGAPMLKARTVKMYMKFENRNIMLISAMSGGNPPFER